MPIRDESAKAASRYLQERAHEVVQREVVLAKPKAPIQVVAQEAAESSDSSRTHSVPKDMVTQKTLTVSHFIPRASQAIQQQQPPQGRVPAPPAHPLPPPPSRRQRKRQRVADLSSTNPGEAQVQTSNQLSRGVTIREPLALVGTNVASSSRPA